MDSMQHQNISLDNPSQIPNGLGGRLLVRTHASRCLSKGEEAQL